jgi:hypothetical protein
MTKCAKCFLKRKRKHNKSETKRVRVEEEKELGEEEKWKNK